MAKPESTLSDARRQRRVSLARLEADVAYFQARLEMIGDAPGTTNQMAQRKVFKLLHKNAGAKILKANRESSELR
jgi:hypothetical protein